MDNFFVWTLGDVITIAVVALIVIATIVLSALKWIKQARCGHEKFFENGQCHAICRNCGKDLGFIGAWREKQKEKGV